jgi:hypothetical protein
VLFAINLTHGTLASLPRSHLHVKNINSIHNNITNIISKKIISNLRLKILMPGNEGNLYVIGHKNLQIINLTCINSQTSSYNINAVMTHEYYSDQ